MIKAALVGVMTIAAVIADASKQATSGAKPLPMTAYKLDLLQGLVRDVMEQLAA